MENLMENLFIDLVSIWLSPYKLRTQDMVDNTISMWADKAPFNTNTFEYWKALCCSNNIINNN